MKPTAEEIEKAARKCASEVLGFEPNEVRPDDTIMFYAGAIWSEAHAKNSSEEAIAEMKEAIIKSLSELSKGYGKRKWAIEKDTGIPVDVLTILLKQLKIEGKIELIMIWSESTGMPNGSGYCLTGL